MVTQIQLRRDTAANWTSADPTLAEGEVGLETDTGFFKFGDGTTAWTGLSYVATGGGMTNPLTTTGDIIYSSSGSTPARRAIGGANTVIHGGTTPTYSAVVEGDLSTSDITTANVTTSKHGFAPKAPNDAAQYLDGTGAYSVPTGTGFTNPMTTTGDIIYSSSGSTPARRAVGAATTVLHGGASVPAYSAVVPADLDVSVDNTTADATTGHHGLLLKLGGGSTNFLRADGTWNAPSGTALNPAVLPEISPPSTPSSGNVAVYAKADGRIYSKDDAGTEYGPFDAGGGGLYVLDQSFPGSSLPGGWTFTGSGTCVVSGGKATITGAAQGDRLLYAYTSASQFIVRAHMTNVSGEGGMPSICVLNSSGTGYGASPYNDSNSYMWAITTNAYSQTLTGAGITSPSLTDVWYDVLVVGGRPVAGGFSTDGTTWTSLPYDQGVTPSVITTTKVGIIQAFNSANISVELVKFQICEP